MKRILKTVLAISLVSSSSMALAEGSLVYRQSLQGVDAVPTFGMTESEKQEYLENAEMCSNQYLGEITEANISEGSYISLNSNRDSYSFRAEGTNIKSWTLYANQNVEKTYKPIYHDWLSDRASNQRYNDQEIKVGAYRPDLEQTYLGWPVHIFEITYFKSSPNYQWCVDNGYETAKS